MFREEGDKISGVLNDYDLAVDSKRVGGGTSRQRTGTKPFLAMELHEEFPPIHCYRHDLESLAYCYLWMLSKRVIERVAIKGEDDDDTGYGFVFEHPLSEWESATHSKLQNAKLALSSLPLEFHAFRDLASKLYPMIGKIVLTNTAMRNYATQFDLATRNLPPPGDSARGLRRKIPEKPAELQFSDYTEDLYDEEMEQLTGGKQSASYSRQLAVIFKVDAEIPN